jgi:hypothetical protein
MHRIPSYLLIVLLILAPAIARSQSIPPASVPSAGAEYIELGEYLTRDADIETWYTAVNRLKQNFDDICGDTFCEGDYGNIESLSFRCSVEKHTGVIDRCVWVFAASNEEIRPSDGRILVDARHWRCRSPLTRHTRIGDLLAALSGPQPMRAALPGTTRSLYDGLSDCL